MCKLSTIVATAMRYCQERSIPLGAVCNGHQLIAFLGSRADGVPAKDGNCLIFYSLADMASQFRTVWDNLSRAGVDAYTLHTTLKMTGGQPPPEKLSARLASYPGFKNRNPFQTDLKILGELFIEDVVRAPQLQKDFLQACYAQSGALINVSASDLFENALSLYVDFGKEPALAEDLEGFVLKSCTAQLNSKHGIDIEENDFVRGVYHSELARFT